jgi:ketosteroid isomerase-like protein
MSVSKTLLLTFCLAVTLSALSQTSRSPSSDESKLIALEKMWNQAQLQHDSGALKSLISDRFVNTEWDGTMTSRDQFLSEIADPKFDPSIMSVQDLRVEFYGDAAIVVGVYHTKGKYNSKPYEHTGRFTDTWVRDNAAWKCVASHTSLIQK